MIRGVLFDMDGVLVNNTRAHVRAFEIFCKRYGVEEWQRKLSDLLRHGQRRYHAPDPARRNHTRKGLESARRGERGHLPRSLCSGNPPRTGGLWTCSKSLRRRGIRCAVGSSGCRENVDFVLSNCGITDYFSCIVSGDRVTRCKPDPEIYLLAAEGLHLPSAECLVFEDARVGITAARRAGAGRIVALATTLPRHTLATQTEADVVIDDFASITDLNTLLL